MFRPACHGQMLGNKLLKISLTAVQLNKSVLEVPTNVRPLDGLYCLMGSALLFFAATLKQSQCWWSVFSTGWTQPHLFFFADKVGDEWHEFGTNLSNAFETLLTMCIRNGDLVPWQIMVRALLYWWIRRGIQVFIEAFAGGLMHVPLHLCPENGQHGRCGFLGPESRENVWSSLR